MKAEHRKELHTNLLADRMGKLLQGLKSGPRASSLAVWAGLALVVVTVFVWRWYSRSSREERSTLWVQMDAALHDDATMQSKLGDLAREHRRTLPGRVARFQLARRYLQDGVRTLPADAFRKEAVERLTKARDEFQQLAGECGDDPVLGPEALMNQARAEEALAGVPDPESPDRSLGDLDRALEAYRLVVKKYPTSAHAKVAGERVKVYEDKDKRRDLEVFYARLREEFGKKTAAAAGP